MDVHRCRFVEYTPAAINAVAFSHPHSTSNTDEPNEALRLAVGRANGDIEIWNPAAGSWFQETVFKGGKDRTIEGLVWTRDTITDGDGRKQWRLRLFSIGYSSEVTEWDLVRGTPLQHANSNYGEVWCIAAQPPADDGTAPDLVVGCDDGTVAVLFTGDEEFRFGKAMSRPSSMKARVLSITYQDRETIVAGYSDSTIRIFNAKTNQIVRNMSVGISTTSGPKDILVWAVAALPDGNIVSGDSTGELKFWDSKTWTLSQRLKVHKADTLCLAVSANGKTVFSGGMDRRTAVSRLSDVKGDVVKRWGVNSHRQFNSNDVKAMAAYESGDYSLVATGGPDTMLNIIPLHDFGQYFQRLPNLPQNPPLVSAPSKRLLVGWNEQELRIWRFEQDEASLSSPPLVAKILLNSEESVSSASVSPDGSLLAVATATDTKVFQLNLQGNALAVKKAPVGRKKGAKLVLFSPDSRWLLVVHNDNTAVLLQLETTIDVEVVQSEVLRRAIRERQNLRKGSNDEIYDYKRSIVRASFSWDSKILAVCDLAGYIDVWQLDESSGNTSPWAYQESSLDLPKLPQSPAVFSFRPHTDAASASLFVVTSEHEIYELQILDGTLSDWSKNNQPTTLPAQFRNLRSRAVGAVWDSTNASRVWIYGNSWVFMVNLATPGGLRESFETIDQLKTQKRRRDSIANEANDVPTHVLKALDSLNRARDLTMASEQADAMEIDDSGDSDDEENAKLDAQLNGVVSNREGGNRSLLQRGHKSKRSRTDAVLPEASEDASSDEDAIEDDDEDEEEATSKSVLAGQTGSAEEHGGGSSDEGEADDDALHALSKTDGGEEGGVGLQRQTRAGWFTNRYQHILGIVPIGVQKATGSSQNGPEVAIVERPPWDLNLPARFQENHDYPRV